MGLKIQWKWVVLVAVYSGIIILCTTMYMGGILYVAILEKYPGQTTKASLVLALNSGFLGLFAPIVTTVTTSVSCRFAMVLGGMLLTIAGVLSAFASSLDFILVTYGIIGGVGNAMVGAPCSVVLGMNFNKHRDVVIALSMSMVAFGILAGVPLVTVLLETYALNGTMLIIAAINAHLCVVGVLCKPSGLELKIQAEERCDAIEKHAVKSENISKRIYSLLKCPKTALLKDGKFALFLLSTLLVNLVYSILFVHLPNYTAIQGSNSAQIAVLTTCFNAGNMVGRLVGTAIVAFKQVDSLVAHSIHVGIMGLITLTFPYYDVFYEAKYVFAVAVGLCSGAPFSLMTPISLHLVGTKNIAAAHGLEYFFFGIGYLVGPPIAGALYGQTGTYRDSFIFTGCLGLLGCLTAVLARFQTLPFCNRESRQCHGPVQPSEDNENGLPLLNKDIRPV